MAREQIKLVVVGHVDHGKSTFIGRLLHDTGSLPEGKLEELEAIARRRAAPLELANFTDAFQAERDQNVTIDTAQAWFRTPTREYVLIDAPGHYEFVKNMVTGAAHAHAACLVVDAAEGLREQSRRHAVLLELLGLRQTIVLVNKMDLAGFDEAAFRRAKDACEALLEATGLAPAAIIPIAARDGDNIAARSARMPWWTGPTALDALDALPSPPADAAALPLRFPVQDVYRFDERRIIAGRVESGTLRAGDRLVFWPGGRSATVKSIERWPAGAAASVAAAGESIGITIEEQIYVERGHVAAAERALPCQLSRFEARILWLGREPLRRDRSYPLKLATQTVDCRIARVNRLIDAATLADVPQRDDEVALTRDEVADVTIRTTTPIAFDPHSENPAFGRFVLMDGGVVAGGGTVADSDYPRPTADALQKASNLFWTRGKVTPEQRARRNRHPGSIVWLTGLSGAGKSTIAVELERALFEHGRQAYVIDGDNLRHGLCADLAFSEEDRVENIRRAGEVAALLADAGMIAIAAFISPFRAGRDAVRAAAPAERFLEVYVNAPLEVCEARDAKGLYARARAGEIPAFTGISSPYEPPLSPELELHTDRQSVAECVDAILDALRPRKSRPWTVAHRG
jgi:bifunctional enzyme CysN/CysC